MDPNNANLPMDITDDDKLWALLCWLLAPFAPLVAMYLMPDKGARPFVKYNAIQALAFSIVAYVLSSILSPLFGIGCIIGLATFIYIIYLAVQAYGGNMVTVPVVTDFCKNQGWI